MEKLFKKKNIYFVERVTDWEEAIRTAIEPLVRQGYCESRYIDGVFENTKKYGPYYVLCENLALIHAATNQGALETQMAVTVLKEPVRFKPDGFDVRILIGLVASDAKSHVDIMRAIGEIFSNSETVEKLLATTSQDVVYDIFANSNDVA
ncbi:MAG: PTS sugar transporter subunit IIA [Erysipelotrichaceae bacterium]|nr:PTS sugar transporter subunit IIA [Erysipelotrichaceae bacterium]MDD3809565.1 PTS sugar transporter subunit IIA [Erysipelotrichaceae bacterium]